MTTQSSAEDVVCPNQDCPDHGKDGLDNIIRFGKTRQGVQRLRCKTCGHTFAATHDTIFYRRRTSHQSIMETLALLAEGVPITSVARAKRIKPDTIRDWLQDAAEHREAIEAELGTEYRLSQAQIAHLWTHLHRNGNGRHRGNGEDIEGAERGEGRD